MALTQEGQLGNMYWDWESALQSFAERDPKKCVRLPEQQAAVRLTARPGRSKRYFQTECARWYERAASPKENYSLEAW